MELIGSGKLAKILGISTQCVSRRRNLGTLGMKSVKKGRFWFYEFDDTKLVEKSENRYADRKALVSLVEDLESISRRLRRYIGKELRSETRVLKSVIRKQNKKKLKV